MLVPKITSKQQPHIKCLIAFVQDKLPSFLKSHISNFSAELIKSKKSVWLLPKRLISNQYESCLVVPLKLSEEEQDKKYRFKKALFQASCQAMDQIQEYKIPAFAIHLPPKLNSEELSLASIQGCVLQSSQQTQKKEKGFNLEEICLINSNLEDQALLKNEVIMQASLNARKWSNQRLTPDDLEEICQQEAKQNSDIKISIIKGEELKNRGYSLIYNVGKSSQYKPRLIHLEYNSDKIKTALVGKGLTFDTGGLNLKIGKASEIEKMHLDKTGACSVLAAFLAAGKLDIKDVSATLAVAENAIDSSSYLPGQIIKTLSGLTVQVGNTDAEGRLCLADAFQFLGKRFEGHQYSLIDLATLTGAVEVALGQQTAGVFGNNKDLIKQLQSAGKLAFEPI